MKKEGKIDAIVKWAISNLIWEYIRPFLSALISMLSIFVQKLGFPMFSDNQAINLAIYFFIIYGMLGFIADIVKMISRAKNKVDKKNREQPSIKAITKNSSNPLIIGGNVSGDLTQNIGIRDKKDPINIIAGLFSENQNISTVVTLLLKPLPKPYDIKDLLMKEKNDLMAGYYRMEHASALGLSNALLYKRAENYPKKVEGYLKDLEDYYQKLYELSIFDDRYRVLYPIVENRSKVSASNVIIDYKFPKAIHFPDKEIERIKNEKAIWKEYTPQPPKKPELLESTLLHAYDSTLLSMPNTFNDIKSFHEKDELEIQRKQDFNIVVYRIKDLLQNRPYTELLPIPIWLDNLDKSIKLNIPVNINARELNEPATSFVEIKIIVEIKV